MCSAATPKNDLLRRIVHLMEERDELRERLYGYPQEQHDAVRRYRREAEILAEKLKAKDREIELLVSINRKLGQEVARLRGE